MFSIYDIYVEFLCRSLYCLTDDCDENDNAPLFFFVPLLSLFSEDSPIDLGGNFCLYVVDDWVEFVLCFLVDPLENSDLGG